MKHGRDPPKSTLEYGCGDSVLLWSCRLVSGLSASIYCFVSRNCQAHSAGILASLYLEPVPARGGRTVYCLKPLPLKKQVLSLVVFLVHGVQNKKQVGFLTEVEEVVMLCKI